MFCTGSIFSVLAGGFVYTCVTTTPMWLCLNHTFGVGNNESTHTFRHCGPIIANLFPVAGVMVLLGGTLTGLWIVASAICRKLRGEKD